MREKKIQVRSTLQDHQILQLNSATAIYGFDCNCTQIGQGQILYEKKGAQLPVGDGGLVTQFHPTLL